MKEINEEELSKVTGGMEIKNCEGGDIYVHYRSGKYPNFDYGTESIPVSTNDHEQQSRIAQTFCTNNGYTLVGFDFSQKFMFMPE